MNDTTPTPQWFVATIEILKVSNEGKLRDGGKSKQEIARIVIRANTLTALKDKIVSHAELIGNDIR